MTSLTLSVEPRISFDFRPELYNNIAFIGEEELFYCSGRLLTVEKYNESLFLGDKSAKQTQLFITRGLQESSIPSNNHSNINILSPVSIDYGSIHSTSSLNISRHRESLLKQLNGSAIIQSDVSLGKLRARLAEREFLSQNDSLAISALAVQSNKRLCAVAEYSTSLTCVLVSILDLKQLDMDISASVSMKSCTVNSLLLPTTVFDAEKAQEIRRYQFNRKRKQNRLRSYSIQHSTSNANNNVSSSTVKLTNIPHSNSSRFRTQSIVQDAPQIVEHTEMNVFDIDSDFADDDEELLSDTRNTSINNPQLISKARSSLSESSYGTLSINPLTSTMTSGFGKTATATENARIQICSHIDFMEFSADGKTIVAVGSGPKYPVFFWQWAENTKVSGKPFYCNETVRAVHFHPHQNKLLTIMTNTSILQLHISGAFKGELLTELNPNIKINSDWVCFCYLTTYKDAFVACKRNIIIISSLGEIIQIIELSNDIVIKAVTPTLQGFLLGTNQGIHLYHFTHANKPLINVNSEFQSIDIELPKKHSLLEQVNNSNEENEINKKESQSLDKNTTLQAILVKQLPILPRKSATSVLNTKQDISNESVNIQSLITSPSLETIAISTSDRQLLTVNIKEILLLPNEEKSFLVNPSDELDENLDNSTIKHQHVDGWRKQLQNKQIEAQKLQKLFHPVFPHLANSPITACTISLDQPYILTVNPKENSLYLYNFISRTCEFHYSFIENATETEENNSLLTAALHPSGLEIAAVKSNSIVIGRWNNSNGKNNLVVRGELLLSNVNNISYSPSGKLIALIQGKSISIYSNLTLKLYTRLTGHTDNIASMNWTNCENYINTVGANGTCYTYEIKTNFIMAEHIQDNCYYTAITNNPYNNQLIAVCVPRVTGNAEKKIFLQFQSKQIHTHDNQLNNAMQFINYPSHRTVENINIDNHDNNINPVKEELKDFESMASTVHGRVLTDFTTIETLLRPTLPAYSYYAIAEHNRYHNHNLMQTGSLLSPSYHRSSLNYSLNGSHQNLNTTRLLPTGSIPILTTPSSTANNTRTAIIHHTVPFTSPFYQPQILCEFITVGRATFILLANHRGCIEVWPWPLKLNSAMISSTSLHCEPITSMKVHQKTGTIISTSLDGSIYISSLSLVLDKNNLPETEIIGGNYTPPLELMLTKPLVPSLFALYESNLPDQLQGSTKKVFDSQFLLDQKQIENDKLLYGITKFNEEYETFQLISNKDLNNQAIHIEDLENNLNSIQSDWLYKLQRDQFEYEKQIKKLTEQYSTSNQQLTQSIRELNMQVINNNKNKLLHLNQSEIEHNKVIQEIEILYERKLAIEAKRIKVLTQELNDVKYNTQLQLLKNKQQHDEQVAVARSQFEQTILEKDEIINNLQSNLLTAQDSALDLLQEQSTQFDVEMIKKKKQSENSLEELTKKLNSSIDNETLLKTQILELKSKLTNSKQKFIETERKLMNQIEINTQLQLQIDANYVERNELNSVIENQENSVIELTEQKEENLSSITSFKEQVEYLLQQIKTHDPSIAVNFVNNTIKSLDTEFVDLTTQITNLKRELNDRKAKFQIQSKQLENVTEENRTYNNLLETLNNDLISMNNVQLVREKYVPILEANMIAHSNSQNDPIAHKKLNEVLAKSMDWDNKKIYFEWSRQKQKDSSLIHKLAKELDDTETKLNTANTRSVYESIDLIKQINELRQNLTETKQENHKLKTDLSMLKRRKQFNNTQQQPEFNLTENSLFAEIQIKKKHNQLLLANEEQINNNINQTNTIITKQELPSLVASRQGSEEKTSLNDTGSNKGWSIHTSNEDLLNNNLTSQNLSKSADILAMNQKLYQQDAEIQQLKQQLNIHREYTEDTNRTQPSMSFSGISSSSASYVDSLISRAAELRNTWNSSNQSSETMTAINKHTQNQFQPIVAAKSMNFATPIAPNNTQILLNSRPIGHNINTGSQTARFHRPFTAINTVRMNSNAPETARISSASTSNRTQRLQSRLARRN